MRFSLRHRRRISLLLVLGLLALGPGAAWSGSTCMSSEMQPFDVAESINTAAHQADKPCHEPETVAQNTPSDPITSDCCGCDMLCLSPMVMLMACSPTAINLTAVQPQALPETYRAPGFYLPPLRPPIYHLS